MRSPGRTRPSSLGFGRRSPALNPPFRTGRSPLASLVLSDLATAEACLTPFVKRLDRPEKVLYLFCIAADAQDNDSVAMIDIDPDSVLFGRITSRLELGGRRDDTHHWGYTDDRTRI